MTADVPLVSIILPVFNAELYLPSALDSLLAQTWPTTELIIVDDASTDSTPAIIAAETRVNITTIRVSENGGVAAARNTALSSAQGEFVWFIDVDDTWSPRFLDIMIPALVSSGADVAICGADFRFGAELQRVESISHFERQETLVGLDATEVLLLGTGALWNKVFRREVLGTSPFPPLRSKSDHGGLLSTLPRVGRIVTVPATLYTYTQRDGSISNGGIPQPHNFVALLPIADESLSRIGAGSRMQNMRSRFHCDLIARALRESWRYKSSTTDYGRDLVNRVSWRDIRALPMTDRRALVTCASAKISPRLSFFAFRLMGRKRWSTRGVER